jgi:hypothetical protein
MMTNDKISREFQLQLLSLYSCLYLEFSTDLFKFPYDELTRIFGIINTSNYRLVSIYDIAGVFDTSIKIDNFAIRNYENVVEKLKKMNINYSSLNEIKMMSICDSLIPLCKKEETKKFKLNKKSILLFYLFNVERLIGLATSATTPSERERKEIKLLTNKHATFILQLGLTDDYKKLFSSSLLLTDLISIFSTLSLSSIMPVELIKIILEYTNLNCDDDATEIIGKLFQVNKENF